MDPQMSQLRADSNAHRDLMALNINLVGMMIEAQNLRNRVLTRAKGKTAPTPGKNAFHDFLAKAKVLALR